MINLVQNEAVSCLEEVDIRNVAAERSDGAFGYLSKFSGHCRIGPHPGIVTNSHFPRVSPCIVRRGAFDDSVAGYDCSDESIEHHLALK